MRILHALAAVLMLTMPADVIDRVMAVVGAQPITLSDVAGVVQFDLIPVPPGTADAHAYVLDRLIDRSLMLAEVDRFQPPEPDPVEITIRVDQMQTRAGSAAAFEKMMAMTGMTREQLRRFVRDSLRMDTYLNQRFGPLLDPREREAAIASWISELRRRAQIRVLYRPAVPTREPSR
jgi:hypothetical protein